MNIELMMHTGNDNAIANAARVSFAAEGDFLSLPEGYSEERCAKLIKYLAKHKHLCPFRHNLITIRCKAPIFLARQLGKHQAGLTWSEVSRRYVSDEPTFWMPTAWRAKPDGSIKQGSGGVHTNSEEIKEWYEEFLADTAAMYEHLVKTGVAPEQARMILPQSMQTEWVWSGNLLAFAHVYKERSNPGAQIEAQEFAAELDKVIRPLFPEAWAALVD